MRAGFEDLEEVAVSGIVLSLGDAHELAGDDEAHAEAATVARGDLVPCPAPGRLDAARDLAHVANLAPAEGGLPPFAA
jgi:hypothetical protein